MLCLIVGVSEVISIFVRKKNARLITPEAFSQALVDFRTEIIEVDAFKLISIELRIYTLNRQALANQS
jgi:hypothetical protein